MRKIIALLIILLFSVAGLSYFYFSKMNSENKNNDLALQIATNNAGLVFSFQNDKSFYQIIEGQRLLQQVLGNEKTSILIAFKQNLIDDESFNSFFDNQPIYLSILPDEKKELNFLITAQISADKNFDHLKQYLNSKNQNSNTDSEILNVKFSDSLNVFFSIKNQVITASTSLQLAKNANQLKKENPFMDYIKRNNQSKKNILASLYLNFNEAPSILKGIVQGNINGEISLLAKQNSYAILNYNFSKEKILFNGYTEIKSTNNYLKLFENIAPQVITITNLLPDNTANYTLYAVDNYTNWSNKLKNWFNLNNDQPRIESIKLNIKNQYRVDLNTIFPVFAANQFTVFQLSTSEKLGAVALSNGEKVKQLLLDISDNYSDEIKIFKSNDILYAFFGEPFKKFSRPFYTIIDNNLIVANNASTIQSFLNSYKHNRLLIQSEAYLDALNQISNTANLCFYINLKNTDGIWKNNLTNAYYKQIKSESGLKSFDTFNYQMSTDKGKFITNLLLNKYLKTEIPDTLTNR